MPETRGGQAKKEGFSTTPKGHAAHVLHSTCKQGHGSAKVNEIFDIFKVILRMHMQFHAQMNIANIAPFAPFMFITAI